VPASCRGQPLREREQLTGGGAEGAHLALDLAFDHAAQAGHHRVLVHVETGTKRKKNVHRFLLCCAAGVGSPSKELYKACSGRPYGDNTGAQGSQVQLETGLGCTKGKTDLVADSRPILS
jgi:hypothetical protein